MTIIPERHRPGVLDEERKFLEDYDASAFPRVAVTADVVLLTLREGRLTVLLVERAQPPFEGHWALPGGFVREGEDLEAAAARELSEETRLSLRRMGATLEQLRTYSTPDRDPRMWVVSTAFVALVPGVAGPRAGGDAADARFWAIDELADPSGPWLAFDHHLIISDAIEWARERIETTAVAAGLLEQPFSLSQLRGVYETVWGVRLDPANFRRKVLSTPGFVEPTGTRAAPEGGGRPAELYHQGTATRLELPLRRPPEREAARRVAVRATCPQPTGAVRFRGPRRDSLVDARCERCRGQPTAGERGDRSPPRRLGTRRSSPAASRRCAGRSATTWRSSSASASGGSSRPASTATAAGRSA